MAATAFANKTDRRESLSVATLQERLGCARQMLRRCHICEHRCGCDRTVGQSGQCGLGDKTWVFRQELSWGDEPTWVPALRVYVGGCNFRCRCCITAPESYAPCIGQLAAPKQMAECFMRALDDGARSISVFGGEPTLHMHTLLAVTAAAGGSIPLVVNTNGYMTPEVIDLLGGVVSSWMVDLKFGNDVCARNLGMIDHYTTILRRNITQLASGYNLHVRHLLMPGHLDCCLRPIVRWLSETLPDIRFSLMTGYVPHHEAEGDAVIGRLNDREQLREARRVVAESPLNWSID